MSQSAKEQTKLQNAFLNWFYGRSVVYLTSVVGGFITVFIAVIHCAITYLLTENLVLNDFIIPICYGILLVPFITYLFSQVFAEFDSARIEHKKLREKELSLQLSLDKTVSQIKNQRMINLDLTKDTKVLKENLNKEIEQRQVAIHELEEKRSFIEAVIALTSDIILFRDIKGKAKDCNKNFLDAFNVLSLSEIDNLIDSDKSFLEFVTANDDILRDSLDTVSYEASINNVVYQVKKVLVKSRNSELLGIMFYGHDITSLINEQKALEKMSKDKSNFISTLSHELRTPLNGIVGLSDLLLQSGNIINPTDVNYLKTINVSAVTLGNIFNDVIDINKFERNTMTLSSEVFSWKEFLKDFNTLSKLMADQKNLDYSFKVDGIDDVFIKSDPVRIRQILWNTIANAIKFTKNGSVDILVKNEVVNNKLKTIISIKDSGIGIAENEHQKIFDMYYQVKGTKQATGTGIGLHVTKVLCDLFGAKIDLQSELGKGSVFTYTFDFDIANDNKNIEEIKSEKLNVLIVEDIDVNIIVTKGLLSKLGHSVMVAKTGKDTLELYKNNKFDVILLDMQLPDMHGLEIADELYSKYNNKTPIIAVTANVITDNNTYKEHHIKSVINKPISLNKLSEALNDVVRVR